MWIYPEIQSNTSIRLGCASGCWHLLTLIKIDAHCRWIRGAWFYIFLGSLFLNFIYFHLYFYNFEVTYELRTTKAAQHSSFPSYEYAYAKTKTVLMWNFIYIYVYTLPACTIFVHMWCAKNIRVYIRVKWRICQHVFIRLLLASFPWHIHIYLFTLCSVSVSRYLQEAYPSARIFLRVTWHIHMIPFDLLLCCSQSQSDCHIHFYKMLKQKHKENKYYVKKGCEKLDKMGRLKKKII